MPGNEREGRRPRGVEYNEWMGESDALMWHIERDPLLRSTVLSAWILDREPDQARVEATLERTERLVPRLRQKVVEDPLGVSPPRWDVDPLYERAYHVRRVRVPGAGTVRDLLDLAAPIAMQAFDKDRPLWELHLVEGLEGGRFGVVMKIHHAMSDGVGMVRMTEGLVEVSRDAAARPLPADPLALELEDHGEGLGSELASLGEAVMHRASTALDRTRRAAGALGRGVRNLATHPVSAAGDLLDTIESIGRLVRPATEPMSPLWRARSLASALDVLDYPLDDMRRAASAAGATLNDVFVAAVAGGLSRFHERKGATIPDELRMSMPINLRDGEKGRHAGNQFVPARFGVPMLVDDPRERMRAVHALVRAQRDEPALAMVDEVTAAINVFGDAAATRLTGAMMKAVDFVTSNVPGPRFPVYMSGARIERMYPFGPCAGAAVNITLFSYDGTAQVGIHADRGAVGDPALLRECLDEGFAEVLAVR